jgi:toxin ParE1/3/4
MAIIRRTRISARDYAAIWDYVAHRNRSAADKLLKLFDEKLMFLSEFPGAGPARSELRARVRSFPVGQYVLFYRPV